MCFGNSFLFVYLSVSYFGYRMKDFFQHTLIPIPQLFSILHWTFKQKTPVISYTDVNQFKTVILILFISHGKQLWTIQRKFIYTTWISLSHSLSHLIIKWISLLHKHSGCKQGHSWGGGFVWVVTPKSLRINTFVAEKYRFACLQSCIALSFCYVQYIMLC